MLTLWQSQELEQCLLVGRQAPHIPYSEEEEQEKNPFQGFLAVFTGWWGSTPSPLQYVQHCTVHTKNPAVIVTSRSFFRHRCSPCETKPGFSIFWVTGKSSWIEFSEQSFFHMNKVTREGLVCSPSLYIGKKKGT